MLITIKNEVLEEISNLRKAKKNYDAAGDLKKGRFTDNLINERCRAAMMDIINGIDKANKREQGQ